jgi:hypothetical protein
MRMAKALIVAAALLGIGAASASAQDYVAVERRASPAGTVLRDTIAGGVVGSAVAGGIILYNMGIDDDEDYDWGRTLAWGAVIGLGAGLVWGIVDATSGPSYAMAAPRAPVRDGQSLSLNVRRADESGMALFPVVLGRF